jgi:hypothetical protein
MGEDILNIIYDKLKDTNFYNYSNNKVFKDTDIKINKYYDIENIPHLKIDFGFETYTVSVD